jgi:hypothetical protein
MDPASAFGLAAAILQVLHFSFEAVGKCRELYQQGCLAENKSTQEITEDLGEFHTCIFIFCLHSGIKLET